jgi:hypothetical protein
LRFELADGKRSNSRGPYLQRSDGQSLPCGASWEKKIMILDDISVETRIGRLTCDHYTYNAVFPIAAFIGAAVLTVPIPVDGDADFLWIKTALVSYSAVGVLVVAPDYLIQITDTASNRLLQNVPSHVANLTGTGVWPAYLSEAKIIKAGCVLNVTLTNNTALAALVNIAFLGFKIFYSPGVRREMVFKFL